MPGPPGGNGGTMPSCFCKHPCQKYSVDESTYLLEVEESPVVVRSP